MSSWKKISFCLLAFIILLLVTLGFLISTSAGLHLLFKAVNSWVPGLSIGQMSSSGGSWKNLTLQDVLYTQPGVMVNARQVHLAVKTQCLWKSKLCVDDISIKDMNIIIDTKKMLPSASVAKTESEPLKFFTSYPIVLSRVTVKNINVKINTTTLSVLDFYTGLRWQEKTLTLTPTTLQSLLIVLPKMEPVVQKQVSKVEIKYPQLKEKLFGTMIKNLFSKPIFTKIFDVQLPLNLKIEEFYGRRLRLTGDIDLTVYKLLLKVSNVDGDIKLDALNIDSSQGSVNARGTATLKDGWPLNLTLSSTLNIDPFKGEKIKMRINGEVRKQLDASINLSGPVDVILRAQAEMAQTGLPLNIELTSKQLYWPFTGKRQFQADHLIFKLSGKMTDYTLSFYTALKGQSMPFATIMLNAKGNEQHLSLNKLTIMALEGKTELKALLDWQQSISWRSELTFNGINIAKEIHDCQYPSKLNGLITTRGNFFGSSWEIDVPEIKLTGNVTQNKINLRGSLRGNSYLQWVVPDLHLKLGRNSANVKGEVGVKNLSLDAAINAPNLNNVLVGLGGTARGLIKVRGTINAPRLLADISARGLRWQELSVAQVHINSDIKSTGQIAGNLNVRLQGIIKPGVNITLVTLNAKGSEPQHQLQLRVQGGPVSGQLDLAGSFLRKEEQWKGALSNTHLQTPVGPWSLNRPIILSYRNVEKKINIAPQHCWNSHNAELCVPHVPHTIYAGAEKRAAINFNRFDLAMLKPFLLQSIQGISDFGSNADVIWDADKETSRPQGNVTLSGRNIPLTKMVVFDNTITISADLHNNRAEIGWHIKLTNHSQLDGQLQVTDLHGRRNLTGNINIRNVSLAMISPIFSPNAKIVGKLNANLCLGGDVYSPQMFGQLQLNGLEVEGNFMPFDMQPSHIAIMLNGRRSTLQGVISTKQGQINLSGDVNWSQIDNWLARVVAQGSQVRITVPPMVRLDVSPDVVFTATPHLLTLDGNIDIPWAQIVVHNALESAVGVSSDVVILDKNLKPMQTQSTLIPINSNLFIHVGNNVNLEAFGLKARLMGDLKVAQGKQGLGLSGQINILEGRFHAYGQDLIVRKGILLFSGPQDQSLLNIEAIRNPDTMENNVIAGVRVIGTADQPKAEIFSEPAMSQQEALSYLLRGQGLDSQQGNSAAMTSMLVGLGVAKSGQIVSKIGKTFGVSNLVLDTQGVGNSSQVVVSGYVLPGLQVKYGVGIFDSLATLTLRYRLMSKLYLEAVSGMDQALSVLYQFEF